MRDAPRNMGHPWERVVIKGIDTASGVAEVENHIGKVRRIPMAVQRAKGLLPEVGEWWVIDKSLGDWTFAAVLVAKDPAPTPLPLGTLGYVSVTGGVQGGIIIVTDVAGASVQVDVGANRRIRITGQGSAYTSVAGDILLGRIKEGGTSLGVWYRLLHSSASTALGQTGAVILTPTAGVHTYKLTMEREFGTGSLSVAGSTSNPLFLHVEDLGAA